MASPLLKRIRYLAAKAEGTPGTAEALTATEGAFNVFNTMIQQGTEMENRQKQGGFAQLPAVPAGRQGRCTFATHFYGGSATPAGMATFLPAVGMGLDGGSAYYQLVTPPPEAAAATQKTVTLGSYQNGRRKMIHGAMGNMKCTFPAGKLAMADFDFLGKWNAPTDTAIIAPTLPSLTPLRVISATFTVGAYSGLKIANVTLDLGNVLYLREDVNDATGFSSCVIADRLPVITIDPESSLVATKDIYAEWLASTEADLSMVLTNGTDTCTITASDLQWMNPQEADRNGLEIDSINCQLNADDLKFLFA